MRLPLTSKFSSFRTTVVNLAGSRASEPEDTHKVYAYSAETTNNTRRSALFSSDALPKSKTSSLEEVTNIWLES